jgi:hypothetical protein
VGVDVDEAGCDHRTVRIERLRRRAGHLADGGDLAVAHAHVAPPRRCAGAVDHGSAADEEIVLLAHGVLRSRQLTTDEPEEEDFSPQRRGGAEDLRVSAPLR